MLRSSEKAAERRAAEQMRAARLELAETRRRRGVFRPGGPGAGGGGVLGGGGGWVLGSALGWKGRQKGFTPT